MAYKAIRPLKDTSNVALFNAIRNDASPDYQRRIPEATKAGISDTIENLHKYRPMRNEFIDALVNRIGLVIAQNMTWTNPLAEFKRGMLSFGDTIEEIQLGLLQAHTYSPDRDYMERDIFGTHNTPAESNFHRVNRQNYYPISVNEDLLNRAFLEPNGVAEFISKLMEAPVTSDNWDEFLMTCRLFSEYEQNGGFYHVNVPNVSALSSTEADSKATLRKMRAMADTLPFVSTQYNAAHFPTFANRDELVLFGTPQFNAAIDVEALAGAFNVDKAKMHGRVVTIPEEQFNIEGCQAIMTTKDFFVIADTKIENTSQRNPVSLNTNYFLHHWQIISASRFVPAVMFWTGADDEVINVSPVITSLAAITIEPDGDDPVTTADRGGLTAFHVEATLSDGEKVDSPVQWAVGAESSATYISQEGVLHVGGDEVSESLTVVARSTWIDPANPGHSSSKTATLDVPVSGDLIPDWGYDAPVDPVVP